MPVASRWRSRRIGQSRDDGRNIRTNAALTMERLDSGWTVTLIHLDVTVKLPGADRAKFDTAANAAKAGCPSRACSTAKITMDAKVES